MKSRWIAIFWSIVMIAAGMIFFLREMGVVSFDQLSTNSWVVIFAVASAFIFLTYFMQGIHNWGWLFPACILGAIALIIGLEDTQLGQTLSGAPVLLAIAIPFLVAFAFGPRRNWWALIPAWVMIVISIIVLLEDRINGNIIGTLVLYSIALPFLVVYLLDRNHRWALIPFAALSIVGLIPLLEYVVGGQILGLVVMFLFAIPFYIIYLWTKDNWWALIPAGVFTSIGLVVLLDYLPFQSYQEDGYNRLGSALLLAGVGLTFGVLWLRRASQPTEWAKYPALGLFTVSGLTLLVGENLQFFWPVVLIAAGGLILILGLLRKPTLEVKKQKDKVKKK